MSILVTGGAGFIGSYVVRDLLALDERVVVCDSHPLENALDSLLTGPQSDGRLILVQGAVTDGWGLLRLCEEHGVDRIVHLASPLTQAVSASPHTGVRDICAGTASIFEVARARQIRRVVWASSVAVFGARHHYPPGPIANDAPHRPESLYGSCKSLCEQLAETYRSLHEVDSIGLRLSVVYGPGRRRGYMSFPTELIRRAAVGDPVHIPIADQVISWQYVGEAARMIVHCLDTDPPRDCVFNTYSDVRSFREAGEILASLAPEIEVTMSAEATEPGQLTLVDSATAYDDREFLQQVGYEPSYPLERGIAESFEFFARTKVADLIPVGTETAIVEQPSGDGAKRSHAPMASRTITE